MHGYSSHLVKLLPFFAETMVNKILVKFTDNQRWKFAGLDKLGPVVTMRIPLFTLCPGIILLFLSHVFHIVQGCQMVNIGLYILLFHYRFLWKFRYDLTVVCCQFLLIKQFANVRSWLPISLPSLTRLGVLPTGMYLMKLMQPHLQVSVATFRPSERLNFW